MSTGRSPVPQAFTQRLQQQFPDLAEEVLSLLNTEGKTSILINALKATSTVPPGTPVPWYFNGSILNERIIFAADPLWHAGTYYVQEASSMLLGYVLEKLKNVPENPKALDLCAAPGGKSHIIQNYLKDKGLLWANEIHPGRAKILQQNISRFGHASVVVSNADPTQLATQNIQFDIVVVDAPCSGEGMFRKDDTARNEWNTGLPEMCASRQQDILESASSLVAESGYLVYSTCTFAEEENILQMARLMDEGGWTCCTPPGPEGVACYEIAKGPVRGLQMFPGLNNAGEGFFIAVLQKNYREEGKSSKRSSNNDFTRFKHAFDEVTGKWRLQGLQTSFWQDKKGAVSLWNEEVESVVQRLTGNVKILQAGVPFATVKGSSYIPEHALALSVYRNNEIPFADLDLEDAKKYLRGNDTGRHLFEQEGWNLVSYKSFALGWVKVLPGRVNNYYPKEQRLLHY
jgi:16S rRNA C967 or C1407 C5-methylase (RsmB/RsmF family)/NOL1/NOP2/fmu family ribosome biogenesis protein